MNPKKRELIFLLIFAFCFFAARAVPKTNEEIFADGKLKVLAVGNSFSRDAVEKYLFNLCKAEGIEIVIGSVYIYSCNLQHHWDNLIYNIKEYNYKKIGDGEDIFKFNVSLPSVIIDEDWDIVTFQQESGSSGIYSSYDPYLTNIVEWAGIVSKAQIWFHQTWAYEQNSTHPAFGNYGYNQILMYDAITETLKQVMDEHKDILDFIPTGTAIQNIRTSYIGDTMTRDGFHLEDTYGRYAAACTWFEKLTGKDIRNNPFTPRDIDVYMQEVIKTGVHNAISNPFVITSIPPLVKTEEITLNYEEATVLIDENLQLEAQIHPDNSTISSIKWFSSDEKIATVSDTGLVTAISEGTTEIKALCADKSAVCEINVPAPIIKAEQIILNPEVYDLEIDESLQLEATVLPENTSDKTLQWQSSNSEVADVSSEGLVIALSPGETIITATCGEVSSSCLITVPNPIIYAEQIILNFEEYELEIDKSLKLEATVLPENTSDKTIKWQSSNPKVATILADGIVIGISPGETIITATCGDVSVNCLITIPFPKVEAQQIILNVEEYELKIEENLQLEAKVLPDDTTDKSLAWNSWNENVATVSDEGYVTAISEGSTLISVNCGQVSATCLIRVIDNSGVESLWIYPEEKISVYTVEGILIKKDCKAMDLKGLKKGIYIIEHGKNKFKISI